MKFTINKKILLQNLNNVSRALSSKNLIPILSGIKFDLTSKGLVLSASDNDIYIETFISKKDLDIQEEGKTIIQGKYILEIVRKLENDIVSIELLDNIKLNIKNGNSNFSLNCMDYNDFPNIKIKESKKPIIITKKDIKSLVYKTCFAVSYQETRPVLTGINFKTSGKKIECVSTDSYRLAKKEIVLSEKTDEDVNLIIPGRNFIEFVKILENEDETKKENNVEIHIESNQVLFIYDNINFQTRILSGSFPDISRLIPKNKELKVEINTIDLFNVIDRASLLTSEKEKNIINFKTSGEIAVISSNSPEIGKVEEKINVVKDKKEKNIEISFSSKFMLEALKAIESKEVVIEFINDIQPIIIKDKNDENYVQLILPIKTY